MTADAATLAPLKQSAVRMAMLIETWMFILCILMVLMLGDCGAASNDDVDIDDGAMLLHLLLLYCCCCNLLQQLQLLLLISTGIAAPFALP